MDNAQKAIMIGVGLFITIIIISAVLLITNLGTDLINNAADEVTNITDSIKNELIAQYQGKVVTEKQLLELIKKYDKASIGIEVNYLDGTTKRTLKLGALTFTYASTLNESYVNRGNVTVSRATAVADSSRKGYVDAVAALVNGVTYRMAGVYNAQGEMLGLTAWQVGLQ